MSSRFALRLFAFLTLLLTGVRLQAQRVPFFSSSVTNASGAPYNGPLQICPVGAPVTLPSGVQVGPPASYKLGNGGATIAACVTVQVTNGMFATNLPDAWLTGPTHACFSLSAQDGTSFTENLPGYPCVQPTVQPNTPAVRNGWCNPSIGCDLGKLAPMTPPVPPMLAGPPGAQGIQGIPGNAGQLATPQIAGVVYTPPGASSATLASVGLSGAWGDVLAAGGTGGATGIAPNNSSGGASGFEETFYFDPHNVSSGTVPPGFDVGSGAQSLQGRVIPAVNGNRYTLVRGLHYTGQTYLQATAFGLQFQEEFAPPANSSVVGFNAAPPAPQGSTNSAQELALTLTGSGFGLVNNGSPIKGVGGSNNLWDAAGMNGTYPASTNWSIGSGEGFGWGAPSAAVYDFSLFVIGDGTCIVSAVHLYGINGSMSAHVPCTTPVCASPCGTLGATYGIQNLEIMGSNIADAVGPLEEMDGPTLHSSSVFVPHQNGALNMGAELRWAIHADGSQCVYDGTETGVCQNIVINLSPKFEWGHQNKWALILHGGGDRAVSVLQGTFDQTPGDLNTGNVADKLYQAGYSVAAIDMTQDYTAPDGGGAHGGFTYGSPTAVQDIANAVQFLESRLPLAPSMALLSDSRGGLDMFNVVALGLVKPFAMIGYSPNISLDWAANGNGQIGFVAQAYNFPCNGCTSSPLYPTVTAGYDPLISAQTPGIKQARLAAVPTLIVADPSDPIVNTNANSTFYAQAINGARPGTVVTDFNHNGQGHVATALFNGPQAVNFLESHLH